MTTLLDTCQAAAHRDTLIREGLLLVCEGCRWTEVEPDQMYCPDCERRNLGATFMQDDITPETIQHAA